MRIHSFYKFLILIGHFVGFNTVTEHVKLFEVYFFVVLGLGVFSLMFSLL
jgi:hypothetical protein